MADPDRILFIAANIVGNSVGNEIAPPAYPNTGDFVYQDDKGHYFIDSSGTLPPPAVLIGPRVWYTAPSDCFDDPTKRNFKQGPIRGQYPDYREIWFGWPSIQYTLQSVEAEEFVLLMQQFLIAMDLDGLVWFALYNGETRTWKMKLGIMEMPTGDFGGGSRYTDIVLGFGFIQWLEYEI
jgi:hypothetical protein